MANKLRNLPYGMTDFATIRREGYYYVDKSGYIPRLETVRFALFLRPRRFGKSLFTNMLKAYYDINYAEKFDALFGNLEIGKSPTELHNTYLVLSFNFSTVKSSPEQVQESFNSLALTQIGNFISNYENILPAGTRNEVMESGLDCAEALLQVSTICSKANQKIYLVIDEYDNFANTLMSVDRGSYEKILHADGFIRYFYNVLKAATTENQAAIDRVYITGVSPLCLSDVTSGFNIAANLSTDPRFNAMVGFTEDDVRTMLEYYSPALGDTPDIDGNLLPAMKAYYDNYCFSEDAAEDGDHLFNSDMALYFIDKCISRKGKIPKVMLDSNVKQDYNKIRMMIRYESQFGEKSEKMQSILNNGYTVSSINPEFQIRELTSPQNLVSLLFYLGLLTYGKVRLANQNAEVIIPKVANEAMRQQYGTYLNDTYGDALHWRTDSSKLDELWNSWQFFGQWEPLITYIASVMHDNDSVRDFGPEGEQFVKGFMLAHLCNGNGYVIRTEAEMGHGYSDIYLYPIASEYRHALVLEIKYLKPTESDDKVKATAKLAKEQVAAYVADKRLRDEAETRGWTLTAAIAVFRGWKAEVIA